MIATLLSEHLLSEWLSFLEDIYKGRGVTPKNILHSILPSGSLHSLPFGCQNSFRRLLFVFSFPTKFLAALGVRCGSKKGKLGVFAAILSVQWYTGSQ